MIKNLSGSLEQVLKRLLLASMNTTFSSRRLSLVLAIMISVFGEYDGELANMNGENGELANNVRRNGE